MQTRTLLLWAGVALTLTTAVMVATGQTPANSWVPVKSIDFSPQHDAMILNFDGTLSRMDEPWFQAKQIAPGTWQILSDGDFMYLVEGSDEALMIDGGYGVGNSREFAQGLTKQPLRFVANTHSHFDHVANNAYFDKAYMSAGTKAELPMPSAAFEGINFQKDYPIEVIGDAFQFHLGNRDLEAILLGNHTPGGTAYLDRKQRILFSGDEIMAQQGIPLRVSVAQFERIMQKLAAHRKDFDTLCAGWEILDASWVDKYLALAQYILAGHQGEPASQAPPAPPVTNWRSSVVPNVPAGTVVYYTHIPRSNMAAGPRAGQGRGGGRGAPDPNIYRMSYGGATVTYDIRRVND
jgi:glyoxylase-like metal-dependent hydrolase (beta-lactamase superfamily II)